MSVARLEHIAVVSLAPKLSTVSSIGLLLCKYLSKEMNQGRKVTQNSDTSKAALRGGLGDRTQVPHLFMEGTQCY